MPGDITIDLGQTIAYLSDRVLEWFGKDAETSQWVSDIQRRLRLNAEQSYWIQCIGMDRPISLPDIYQPAALLPFGPVRKRAPGGPRSIIELAAEKESSVIFAGPGIGKSTLMKWTFLTFSKQSSFLPVLFSLRSNRASEELAEFVANLQRRRGP